MEKLLLNTQGPVGYELTLKVLGESASPRAEDTLFAAMSDSHPQMQERIFDILTMRPWSNIGPRIILSYNSLTPHARAKVLQNIDSIAPYIKKAIEGNSSEARSNALRIVSNANRISLLPSLLGLLRNFEERYRKRIEKIFNNNIDGLLGVLRHSRAENFEELPQAISRAAKTLMSVLAEALRSFSRHRLHSVTRGLLLMGRAGHNTLLPYFNEENPEIVKQVSDILQDEDNPDIQPFVALLLSSKAPVAIAKGSYFFNYSSAEAAAHIVSAILGMADAAKLRQTEQNLGATVLWKAVGKYAEDFDAAAQKILLNHIKQKLVPTKFSGDLLQTMLNSAYAEVREMAMALAEAMEDSGKKRRMRLLGDSDETTQITATRELIDSQCDDREELIARQLISDSPAVRAIVGKEVAKFDFRAYFKAFERLETQSRRRIAEAAKKVDANIAEKLREALRSGEPYAREKTIQTIGLLGIGAQFAAEILAAALPGNSARARIAALKTLDGLEKQAANRTAAKCLSDTDRRIVVAALEALEKNRCAEALDEAMKLSTHPGPRVRAQLVLYLRAVGKRNWLDELEKMLSDSLPNMRVAAISVVLEVRHETAVQTLRTVAENDDDARVRSIAKEALDRLTAAGTGAKERP